MHDDCKLRFLELKAKRTYRFIVFKIEEKLKQVVVEKLGETEETQKPEGGRWKDCVALQIHRCKR